MLIRRVRAAPLPMRHIPEHQTSFTTYKDVTNVLVEIEGDDGLIGIGEGALIPQHLGEDQETALRTIEGRFAPLLIGVDPFDVSAIHARLRRVVAEAKGAKSAIDIAIHDLQARSLGVPLFALLGGRVRESFPTATGIGYGPSASMIAEIERQIAAGFHSFEVKMSGNAAEDLVRCRDITQAVPADVALILDPNEGWTVSETIEIGRRIEAAPQRVFFEQPVHKENVSGMAMARRAMRVPIIAHEPVTSPAYAYELVRAEAADVLNVTIARLGSFRACMDVVAISEAAGISYRIDAPIQSRIGDTAVAHLGLATNHVLAACDTHLNVDCPTVMTGGLRVEGETVTLPDATGLGVELAASPRT